MNKKIKIALLLFAIMATASQFGGDYNFSHFIEGLCAGLGLVLMIKGMIENRAAA